MIRYLLSAISILLSVFFLNNSIVAQPIESKHKIGPGLQKKVAEGKISEESKLKVSVWIKIEESSIEDEVYLRKNSAKIYKNQGKSALKSKRKELKEKHKIAIKDATEPLIQYLKGQKIKIVSRSAYAPVIFVEIAPNQLNSLLNRDDVATVDISYTYEPELQNAGLTVGANIVWARGITGDLIQVAVVERGGIEFANPNLANGSYYDDTNHNIGDHVTGVAGNIVSTHADHRGIAYEGLGLLSANSPTWYDNDLIAASDWAIDQGATVLNCSFGEDTNLQMVTLDRYYDYVSRHDFVTVVKSAGNNAGGYGTGTANVTSPGLGYNVITVGSIYAHDNGQWNNDTMSAFSSFNDPISTNGDREKPEVLAVGEDTFEHITTTRYADPWIGSRTAGTSFAAPIVAGLAALLQDRDVTLTAWPEAIKAIIMASAFHNIEGDSRLSDRDGAGGIHCGLADRVVNEDWYDTRVISSSSFDASGNIDIDIDLYAGEITRAVIVWTSNPSADYSTDTLDADLDLEIIDPDGNPVVGAVSNSMDNSFEIVEFTPTKTGTYMARVTNKRFDGVAEFFAIAWAPRITTEKVLHWLRDNQENNGSWQNHVGYTAMASLAFLNDGYAEDFVNTSDPVVTNGIQYLLSNVQGDGGIYNWYGNYETSLSILALKASSNADYNDEIVNAANYLKSIQSDDSDDSDHSWYGGWGYGASQKNIWSDLSNSQFSAMALDAAEVPKADIVWTRFLRFLSRVQNLDAINDMPWADGRTDGGFTYSPHVNLFNYFNSYGSMTAAGLWGLRLSGVEVADNRVQTALGWLELNEDLNFNSNPMWGDSNRYYYYMAFAKAMAMCFLSQDDTGTWYESWYDRLKEKIASEQHSDGYWNQSQGMWVDTFWALLTLQTQQPLPANLWMSIILASPADLLIYDPQDRVCSKDECNIPGATFEVDDDGNQVVNLTELEPGHYRFVFHGTGDGTVHLTVNGHRDDEIISTVTKEFEIKEYEVWESDVLVSSLVGALTINVEDPTPPPFVPVCIDIQPENCPNCFDVRSKGVLPVAILGTEVFDVTQIDPDSVYLEGVYRKRYNYEDVTGPHECDCGFDCESPDGNVDMTLKFDRKQIIPVIGEVNDGDVIELTLTGNLKSEFGGTPIQGTDTIIIEKE